MKNIVRYIKCILGFGTIDDGSVCWFSEKYFNVHDYKIHKGGNGIPSHFTEYTCPKCGMKFWI